MADNVRYEMSTALPEFDNYYGLLMGVFYTVPYSILGLFAGILT